MAVKNIINRAKEESYNLCNKLFEHLTVTWDGIIIPCCYDFDKLYSFKYNRPRHTQ